MLKGWESPGAAGTGTLPASASGRLPRTEPQRRQPVLDGQPQLLEPQQQDAVGPRALHLAPDPLVQLLVDGGQVTVPTFRMFDVKGGWFAEGHGVEPDIPVDEDPTELARGVDPQLERAIVEVMRRLEKQPAEPRQPGYERRTADPTTSSK